MTSPPAQPPQPASADEHPHDPAERQLLELRALLLGPEQEQIEALRHRLDDPQARTEHLSEHIAEAIALRARQDRKLQTTMQPLIEEALRISVARDPGMLATSLFPIIGEAVRKAVAHALQGMFDSLNLMLDRGLSLESWRWRFEAWRTGRSFGQVALTHSLSYRVEQVFLIHRETGLLLGHVAFSDGVVQDADLISSMLTAIQDFVRDSFGPKKSDDLEVMQVGDFKLWLQHGPLALLAAVVSGQPPPELREVFVREVEAIHAEFGPALIAFDGDTAPLTGTEANLRRCLLGGARPAARKSHRALWAVALLLLLVFAAFAAIRIRDNLRWAGFVETLRGQPGIVVIEEHRHWLHYTVSGLHDPLAADPGQLLAGSRLPANRVTQRWEPYLSLDPRFESLRRLDTQKTEVERHVLHFDLNSSQLPMSQYDLLETVETDLKTLRQTAAANHRSLTVAIAGHTDRTGKETHNVELSQARAETVVKALTERGIPPASMVPSGVADTSPGHRGVETYPQELDRRVTFHVTLAEEPNP